MKKIKTIIVFSKFWFSKNRGNLYTKSNVHVVFNNGIIESFDTSVSHRMIGIKYFGIFGLDIVYYHLREKKYLPSVNTVQVRLPEVCKNLGITLVYEKAYVARKCDL